MMRVLCCWLVRCYQRLTAHRPPCCRFVPTCSHYALTVLEEQPWPVAMARIFWRLCRCHPLGRGGVDCPPSMHHCYEETSS